MRRVTLKERTDALARVPIFTGLSRSALERIARHANHVELRAGQVLIEPRAKGSGMFVLLDGAATVGIRGKSVRELGPGDIVGELALLTEGAVRTARVRATTPVRCVAISRNDFRKILSDEPRVALAILETVAARLASLQ
jgi:CRP-like cAMP-binding protein